MNAPFPTEDAFREVCLTFLETYASFIPSLDKQRIYTGWTWREHRTKYTAVGYLEKRSTFVLPISPPPSSSNTRNGSSSAGEGERLQDGKGRVGTEEVGEGILEENEDGSASQERIRTANVEFTVFRSATYFVPQLYIRAWDGAGAPISLDQLLPLLSLHAAAGSQPSHTRPSDGTAHEGGRTTPSQANGGLPTHSQAEGGLTTTLPQANSGLTITGDSVFLPAETEGSAEFPLLQFAEHPTSGLGCWSVHPCHVADAVSELVAESGRTWLETWFMLSGNVVDLR